MHITRDLRDPSNSARASFSSPALVVSGSFPRSSQTSGAVLGTLTLWSTWRALRPVPPGAERLDMSDSRLGPEKKLIEFRVEQEGKLSMRSDPRLRQRLWPYDASEQAARLDRRSHCRAVAIKKQTDGLGGRRRIMMVRHLAAGLNTQTESRYGLTDGLE